MKKKIIGILLSLCVVAAMFPMTAFGDDEGGSSGTLRTVKIEWTKASDLITDSDNIEKGYTWNEENKVLTLKNVKIEKDDPNSSEQALILPTGVKSITIKCDTECYIESLDCKDATELVLQGDINIGTLYMPDHSEEFTISFEGNHKIVNIYNNSNGKTAKLEIKASEENEGLLTVTNITLGSDNDILLIADNTNVKILDTVYVAASGIKNGKIIINGTLTLDNAAYGLGSGQIEIGSTGYLNATLSSGGSIKIGGWIEYYNNGSQEEKYTDCLKIADGGRVDLKTSDGSAAISVTAPKDKNLNMSDVINIENENKYFGEKYGLNRKDSEGNSEYEEEIFIYNKKDATLGNMITPASEVSIPVATEIVPDSGHHHTMKYTVKFDSNGGSEVEDKVLTSIMGKVLEDVTAPTYEGKEFAGWTYEDAVVTEDNSFFSLTKNFSTLTITLTAQWNEVPEVIAPTDKDDEDSNEPAEKPTVPTGQESKADEGTDVPKTGDTIEITLLLMLLIVSGLGTVALYGRKKASRQ